MARFSEPYIYRLTISNATRYHLSLGECRRNYGIWYRDAIDDQGPIAVPAGATVEALGIRASTQNTKGYECRCAWVCDSDDFDRPGAISLFISVPFVGGRNKAGLDVTGHFTVQGWTGVSAIGHRFEHSLTVSYVP